MQEIFAPSLKVMYNSVGILLAKFGYADFERAIMFYRMALHAFEYDTVKDRPQSETSAVIHAVVEEAANTLYTLGG